MNWIYYVSWLHSFNSLRLHLSRDLLLLDIIFVIIKKEMNSFRLIEFWNASVEGTIV